LGLICRDIYFIYENNVDVYYGSNDDNCGCDHDPSYKAFTLKEGSYFGEISMLFETNNTYRYICQENQG